MIQESDLVEAPNALDQVRFAFAIEWAGNGTSFPRLTERFRHVGNRSIHGGLSQNPEEWEVLDLVAFEQLQEDRRLEIAFDFEQPMDGIATVVIEDEDGNRVRNLISGQFFKAGAHRIVWDGLNDDGEISSPGQYFWRSISHPGLEAVYQMEFVDAKGSNHGTFHSAAHNGTQVVLGTPVSEGGYQVIVLDAAGTFVRGFNAPHGVGLQRIQVAADDQYIYAAYDGRKWGDRIDRNREDWKSSSEIALVRFEIESGKTKRFDGLPNLNVIESYEVGPGSPGQLPEETVLKGLSLWNGRLYLANTLRDEIVVIDPESGEVVDRFPLPDPVAIAGGDSGLFAIHEERNLVQFNPENGSFSKVCELEGKPSGLCLGPDGNFYVSDQSRHVVYVLDEAGKQVSQIGSPGGTRPGPYDPLQFKNPEGMTVVDGFWWVTERDRWLPKRYVAIDLESETVAKEYFGPTNYGAQGAGFDYEDETRWIGQSTLFELDFENKTSKPVSLLGGEGGRRHTFHRQDGRTFIISSGKATYIQELMEDGTLRPLALFSSAHQYAYSEGWTPPADFVEALLRDYPGIKVEDGKKGGIERIKPGHGYGMLWVDRNGDTILQAEEVEFANNADDVAGSGWSHDFHDLTIRVPAMIGGEGAILTLEPEGWWPGGAPKYPSLREAVENAKPSGFAGSPRRSSAVDRFGNLILNGSPLTGISSEGEVLWTYPNEWVGVHGSHKAPLPSVGELQGALFFSGMVPLDEESDVMFLNGNHGRAFLLTSDGLYLDELFPDVRMAKDPFAGGIGILGGECFGGTFGRSEKTGKYYFQGGGICYRIYEIKGLAETVRQEGTLGVSVAQVEAVERNQARIVAENAQEKFTQISPITGSMEIDGFDREWPGEVNVEWTKDKRFPVKVRAAYDEENLYLFYSVRDDSPWRNQGKDLNLLFKTGDGVDLQLQTDPEANPMRHDPVQGDLRLFIAPSSSGDQVVLYRHRVPGADDSESVVFQSPWRSEKVDVVERLSSAQVVVKKYSDSYTVEAAIPLSALGLADFDGGDLRGDFGVIYGDVDGTINVFRNYWSNQSTGLVNDVPGEIMLRPSLWSRIEFKGFDDE
ncbi:MAG: FlgD immunoglobulin-like domain containing protein [Puniceicoccales bacterium]